MTELHGYTLNGAVHASGDYLLFRAQKDPDRSQELVKPPFHRIPPGACASSSSRPP